MAASWPQRVCLEPDGPGRRRVLVGPDESAVTVGYLDRLAGPAGTIGWQARDTRRRRVGPVVAVLDEAVRLLIDTHSGTAGPG